MLKKLSIKQRLVLIFFIAGLSLITGCVSTGQKATESAVIGPDINILRVGVRPNAPPLIFKQGIKIVGLEADFAREFAKYLDKSLRFVELEWKDQIPALLENRIDIIMSAMTRTPLREVRIAFTARYLESGQTALIRRKDAARFSTGIFGLATSSAIGVVKNTFGEYFVDERYSNVKKKEYSDPRAAAKAVIDKNFGSIPQAMYWAIVTMTTVGYGDIVPQTTIGKIISAALILLGYSLIIVPSGFVTAELTSKKGKGSPEAPIEEEIECPRCASTEHHDEALYCYRCGERIA